MLLLFDRVGFAMFDAGSGGGFFRVGDADPHPVHQLDHRRILRDGAVFGGQLGQLGGVCVAGSAQIAAGRPVCDLVHVRFGRLLPQFHCVASCGRSCTLTRDRHIRCHQPAVTGFGQRPPHIETGSCFVVAFQRGQRRGDPEIVCLSLFGDHGRQMSAFAAFQPQRHRHRRAYGHPVSLTGRPWDHRPRGSLSRRADPPVQLWAPSYISPFAISACTATPQDLPPSLAQHRSCRRSSTSSSLPFRTHMGAHNSVVGADQGFRAPSGDQESVRDAGHEDSASAPIAAGQRPRQSFRHPHGTDLSIERPAPDSGQGLD